MDSSLIGRLICKTLDENNLPYKKFNNQGMLILSELPIGDSCKIRVSNEFVDMVVSLSNSKEISEMKHNLYFLGNKFENLSYIRKQTENGAFFEISIFPFKKRVFEALIIKFSEDFAKEIYPADIEETSPSEFFIKQYRLFRTISEKDQALLIEPVLVIKEKFFKNSKSISGIYRKLKLVKKEIYSTNQEKKEEVDLDEFILVDFAALFRVIELGLLKFTVKDFFENFEKGGRH